MGTLTHAQLVTEALELAGNTGLTTRAQTWLGIVLRRLNEKFTFPQLAALSGTVTVSAADGAITIGKDAAADVFPLLQVNGVRRVMLATASALNDWEDLIVENGKNVSAGAMNAVVESGRPRVAIVEPSSTYNFTVALAPVPDVSYHLLIIGDSIGLSQAVYSAAVVNPYPDDLTVIQGIYALALKHQQDERAASEWALFEDMEKKDRVRYGNMNKANSKVALGGPHKRRNPNDSGGGWMGPV